VVANILRKTVSSKHLKPHMIECYILERINTQIYTGAQPASARTKCNSLIHPKTVLIP
jgi:hypothetical protein